MNVLRACITLTAACFLVTGTAAAQQPPQKPQQREEKKTLEPVTGELLHFGGVLLEPRDHALHRATKQAGCLQSHHPVNHVAENLRGREASISLFSMRRRSCWQAGPYVGCGSA